jgi:hypothetical protein
VAARPILIISNPPAAAGKPQRAVSRYAAVSDYWALTKPEVNVLIAVATFTGFYLGHATQSQSFPFLLLINTLLGTLLVASGHGHAEPVHRAALRRSDASDCPAAARGWPAETFRSSVVRGGSVDGWQHLSCDNRQCICECARDCHLAVLFVSLHSA